MFCHWVAETMSNPEISLRKHHKKCVFGVFLKHARIALLRKNFIIDLALKSGARGRNRTTDTRIFNRGGNKYLNKTIICMSIYGVRKSVILYCLWFGSNTASTTNGGAQCLAPQSNTRTLQKAKSRDRF